MDGTCRSVDSGRLSTVDAIVTADGGRQTLAAHTIGIDNDTALTLSIDSSEDVVLSGESVQYTLTFGNRSISSVTGATLTFPVPAAATSVNSSGGTLSNGMISWNLGTLAAGEGGRRTVTATIGGSAADLVPVDAAELTATSTGPEVDSRDERHAHRSLSPARSVDRVRRRIRRSRTTR